MQNSTFMPLFIGHWTWQLLLESEHLGSITCSSNKQLQCFQAFLVIPTPAEGWPCLPLMSAALMESLSWSVCLWMRIAEAGTQACPRDGNPQEKGGKTGSSSLLQGHSTGRINLPDSPSAPFVGEKRGFGRIKYLIQVTWWTRDRAKIEMQESSSKLSFNLVFVLCYMYTVLTHLFDIQKFFHEAKQHTSLLKEETDQL